MVPGNNFTALAAFGITMLVVSHAAAQQPGTPAPGLPAPPPLMDPAASAAEPAAIAVVEEEEDDNWLDQFQTSASIDSYFAFNYHLPPAASSGTTARAFDAANGFQLAAVGLDIAHEPEPVGGALQLRFSPYSAAAYAGFDGTTQLQFVKQAYGSWRPGGQDGKFTLDVGKFDTIYGAEVFDSWQNQTYTRGLLFWLGQPLFHTGLRATWQVAPWLDAKFMVVNGWSQNADLNLGKSFGVQLSHSHGEQFAISLGWYGGPEQADSFVVEAADGTTTPYKLSSNNKRFRHLADLVVSVAPSKSFTLLLNADYGTENVILDPITRTEKRMSWYGAMLSGRYAVLEQFAIAARGEVYADPQGYTFAGLVPTPSEDGSFPSYTFESATLTLEAVPSEHFVVRLDNRVDIASEKVFASGPRDTSKSQMTTTLGAVFLTD